MKLEEHLLDCVHCGFCLPACPTYAELGKEMDSPRGRIYLLRAYSEKRVPLASIVEHLDLCLDCRACESACPSGVRFGRILEEAREHVARAHRRPAAERLLRWLTEHVFANPRRFRLLLKPAYLARALRITGLLPARLREMAALLPPRGHAAALPEVVPPKGPRRLRVALLVGCAGDVLCPEVNSAIASVLARGGCEVVVPRGQGCCGAIHIHSGSRAEAKRLARRNIDALCHCNPDHIVTNAAGCTAALRGYGELLADDPDYSARAAEFASRVRDFSEVVIGLEGFGEGLGALPQRVAYHDACHLAHAQGIRAEPRRLLDAVPGLERVELPESDWCCGGAGVYNLLQPEMARRLLARKLEHVAGTGAAVVVAGNVGCLLQIRAGLRDRGSPIEALHPAEVLERAYRAGEEPGKGR